MVRRSKPLGMLLTLLMLVLPTAAVSNCHHGMKPMGNMAEMPGMTKQSSDSAMTDMSSDLLNLTSAGRDYCCQVLPAETVKATSVKGLFYADTPTSTPVSMTAMPRPPIAAAGWLPVSLSCPPPHALLCVFRI